MQRLPQDTPLPPLLPPPGPAPRNPFVGSEVWETGQGTGDTATELSPSTVLSAAAEQEKDPFHYGE